MCEKLWYMYVRIFVAGQTSSFPPSHVFRHLNHRAASQNDKNDKIKGVRNYSKSELSTRTLEIQLMYRAFSASSEPIKGLKRNGNSKTPTILVECKTLVESAGTKSAKFEDYPLIRGFCGSQWCLDYVA